MHSSGTHIKHSPRVTESLCVVCNLSQYDASPRQGRGSMYLSVCYVLSQYDV